MHSIHENFQKMSCWEQEYLSNFSLHANKSWKEVLSQNPILIPNINSTPELFDKIPQNDKKSISFINTRANKILFNCLNNNPITAYEIADLLNRQMHRLPLPEELKELENTYLYSKDIWLETITYTQTCFLDRLKNYATEREGSRKHTNKQALFKKYTEKDLLEDYYENSIYRTFPIILAKRRESTIPVMRKIASILNP